MNNFIIYSIEIAISLALFYTAYWLFLKKETFFKLNRFYLIFSVAVALLMPLLNITIGTGSGTYAFVTSYMADPVQQYEQHLSAAIDQNQAFGTSDFMRAHQGMYPPGMGKIEGYETDNTQTSAEQPGTFHSAGAAITEKKINWMQIATLIYFLGVTFFLVRFIINVIWIYVYASRQEVQIISGMKIIRMKKNSSPFSFMNLLFISQTEYAEEELMKIIAHEKVHIQQRHSLDLLLMEVVLAFQWFNPFVWFYKRSIKITHEYLADQGTIKSGIDLPSYQYSLLNQILRENNFEIASNYNLIIKKRIAMMMRKRSTKLAALKLVIAMPILCFLFSAFAFKTIHPATGVRPDNYELIRLQRGTDTLIKEEKVPIEYLKLLEGVYIASKGKGVFKKIKIEEALGSLFGKDNGYRYKLIPVGNGKFINPDGGVPVVFDANNKDAVTLTLFGITLTKTDDPKELEDPKKSVAFKLARIIEKDGMDAALSQYKEIKNSQGYDLNEAEMNLVGYRLLWLAKKKEALSVFKLNTDAFPNSFKAFTGYGDAFLSVGDKTHAIDNYKKSLQLNPGSREAAKKLTELGVNTADIVKRADIPLAYLKLLEGYYLSTNESWGITKINFTEENGMLFGNDKGYHYELFPLGDGKFVNRDDGATFVFDTKNKKEVTLLLFGKINLKKVEAPNGTEVTIANSIQRVNVPLEDLKQLEGKYISTDDPHGVREITFTEEKGELFGTDNGYHYSLIPVGNGKFVNPDDGAALVFDTKNKKEINLLLFGAINLKKVK